MIRRLAGLLGAALVAMTVVPVPALASTPAYTFGDRCAATGTPTSMAASTTPAVTPTSSSSDTTPPALGTVTATPTQVDVSSGTTSVTIDAGATDAESGVRELLLTVQPPSGMPNDNWGLVPSETTQVSGTMHDGHWALTWPLNTESQNGTWTILKADLMDNAGNRVTFDAIQGGSFVVTGGTPQTLPPAPLSLAAWPGNQAIDLSWLEPLTNGGSTITEYLVRYSTDNGETWSEPGTAAAHSSTKAYFNYRSEMITVPALTQNGQYMFEVAAINGIGTGPWSQPTTPSPNIGSAPYALTPTAAPGDGFVALRWSVGSGSCRITTHWLRRSSDNGVTWSDPESVEPTLPSADATYTVAPLSNGVTHLFEVADESSIGRSAWSSPSNAVVPGPQIVPNAPTGVTAVASDDAADVSWTAPSPNGGPDVIGYDVSWEQPGATNWSDPIRTSATSMRLPDLLDGLSYVVRVAAVNSVGESAPSAVSNTVTPRGVITWTDVSASTTVASGTPYTFQGHLTPSGHVGVFNTHVEVWGLRPGATSYTKLMVVAVGVDSSVSFQFTPKLNMRLQYRYLGGPAYPAVNSPTRVVNVRPAVSIASTSSTLNLGGTVKIYGTFTPGDPLVSGTKVTLQVQTNGVYKSVPATATVAKQTLPNGKVAYGYVITYRPPARGTFNYRVMTTATSVIASNGSTRLTLAIH